MATGTFTPSVPFDMSKEKDWPLNMGMLDWDATSIVFTKRTLIEFLKYTGVTVDTNFSNIQKLPRYAQFGKLSAPEAIKSDETATDISTHVHSSTSDTHSNIFNDASGLESDALSSASGMLKDHSRDIGLPPVDEEEEVGINFPSKVKPSRRVRTVPGGPSSISNIFANENTEEEFKPTRRVSQRPGGQDSVAGLF